MTERVRRSVLITGGTGALGAAVTRRFLEDGHRVSVTWRREDEVDVLRRNLGTLGKDLIAVNADVTAPESIARARDEVATALGAVEVLVYLVGGFSGGSRVHEHSLEAWDSMMELNLRTAFLCCRATLPAMRERGWGRIVLVSSQAARADRIDQGAYAVAKSGVAVLAEVIAEENRELNVTASAIAPSLLDTPANRAAMPDEDHSRWVALEDVAATIAFLASEEGGRLRGAWLPITGFA
jgi:NAD(P)-dependent dehydrogenase (short-subunit alcohol dehydrogenase family)